MKKKLYSTYTEAKQAVITLGIKTVTEYKQRYKEDPHLPYDPDRTYAKEWPLKKGWPTFLGKEIKEYYPTFSEAQQAAIALSINSSKEYPLRYKEDPRLPSAPDRKYANEWPLKKGWPTFLGKEIKEYYPTFSEAQQAVIAQGITTRKQYSLRYKEDPRLPSTPNIIYAGEWPLKKGWPTFLGKEIKEYYPTFSEAQQAVIAQGITTRKQYSLRYKEDPRLPSTPNIIYAGEWPLKKGWPTFLGKEIKQYYTTFSEAQQAVIAQGITTSKQYRLRYKEDPRLPPTPNIIYAGEWPPENSWLIFLGQDDKITYSTFIEAQQAVIFLDINSSTEYRLRYKEDPRLPFDPVRAYDKEWPLKKGWSAFLGKETKEYYPTFAEAQQAVTVLGITTSKQYKLRYKEDPRLALRPNRIYAREWPPQNGWLIFLGQKDKTIYPTFAEAQKAVFTLGIVSSTEYRPRYKEDPRLPSAPDTIYAKEWPPENGWLIFLGQEDKITYPTFAEAQQAVFALGIASPKKYRERYKEDPCLPSAPSTTYAGEWPPKNGWSIFLGKEVKEYYPTFNEAQQAVTALGIVSTAKYREHYKEDPYLPFAPEKMYAQEWPLENGWLIFLRQEDKITYPTFAEAQQAAIALGIASFTEYKQRYKADPRLPSQPNRTYAGEWPPENGWPIFLGQEDKVTYPTFAEAQQAAIALGIASFTEYKQRYKADPRLRSQPNRTYVGEWPPENGWPIFLGQEDKITYPTFAEAQQAAIALGIASSVEYQQRYKADPRLPCNPMKIYAEEWPSENSWPIFLGQEDKITYPTFAEAQQAAIALGIASSVEYQQRYKEDPRLPYNPMKIYAEEWPSENSWPIFLGKEVKEYYSTFAEAQQAVIALGIASYTEYQRRYKADPRLPFNPMKIYAEEWPPENSWPIFLGQEDKVTYPTFAEAQQAAIALGIASYAEYKQRYKADLRLPSKPNEVYTDEWSPQHGWSVFLEQTIRELYPTFAEAQQATVALGIASSAEYQRRYKENPRLPSNPMKIYAAEWPNNFLLMDFCLPSKIDSYKLLVQAVKVLNIKDSKEYKEKRKQYKQLPSQPKRSFPNEFVDWYQLCGIPKPYPYAELQKLVQRANLRNQDEYKKWRIDSNDPRIPSDPHEKTLYKNEWVNWYVFLGNDEPFQPKYIHEPYLAWRDELNNFMKIARGAVTKKAELCKFVRLYVQKYQLGYTPLDFVFNKSINISDYKQLISDATNTIRMHSSINEFIDYIIKTKCTEEDPETGELIRINDARNRIKHITLPGQQRKQTPDETVKPALSYQYVENLRRWAIPSEAKNFSDLTHLQQFDADWVEVPRTLIDENDPDCVYQDIDDEFVKLWIPIYWMHAYALFSVPLRGVQIAYNDSGEADSYIPEYKNGKIKWVKNKGELAGLTKNQGMIKRYPKGEFGMFSTSNKTSLNQSSQSVPWMPLELAYWLIKLRKWQSKYNPIKAPTQWLDCNRTHLNETQRKQKGANCFLFRDFGEEECGTFGGRLANRLAAGLYYSQPKGITLATCIGNHKAISKYKSEYTPHSMRVSLITIYVMEYNLDLSIIMKIAGHSSIIMSVYYVKTQGVALRKKIEEGEKIALKSQAKAAQNMIEQLRVEELKPNLVANSKETLNALSNNIPAGNYLFRDWGICPHAGTRCDDGGVLLKNTGLREPTPAGYLGGENCIRCRHFITGPAFLGGLLAIFQEIILQLESKQSHYDDLLIDESNYSKKLEKEDEKEYVCNKKGEKFNPEKRKEIYGMISKTRSEYEVVAKKMDMLYCDLGAVSTLVHQCQALLNKPGDKGDSQKQNVQLIVKPDHELQVITEEVSHYELLSEVCENAEIYQSASAELAITPRTQLIDKMMLRNNLTPQLFTLTPKQQLKAGNQINRLLLQRLKSRTKINELIEGKLFLNDLAAHERIEPIELKNILNPLKIDIKED